VLKLMALGGWLARTVRWNTPLKLMCTVQFIVLEEGTRPSVMVVRRSRSRFPGANGLI
jgi:hypothetical protein